MRDQSDTRARIQQVALELFTEQGYEATSLREIAERLGVTKAALYYHFKTKEDIVSSLVQDRIDALEELIAWAGTQAPGPGRRREFIQRYAAELHENRHHEIMRFFERNQTALRDHPKSEQMRERMFEIINILSSPGDPLTVRLKGSMAIFALHATWFVLRDESVTDAERRAAAIQVALELVEPGDESPAQTGGGAVGQAAAR
ncbi:TetR/AcrR family transcriptional regulator [Rugosimonospora africana]|uniref:TetR family transcriptional regulator n=1 Tax=Rugosimonospora africana TaxID=556532 RepID=A0A8J3QKS4_9ACTN|nr:TetR/AcrR family transcriptional regulator [Rugosimonospora africana]GIH12764.1 TetR family transcriptional regulator [Rugosimonospora africana]